MRVSSGDDIAFAQHRLGPAHIDLRPWPPIPAPSPSQWKHAKVIRDPVVGRSVEAVCVIPPGTLIKSERPVAKILYPSHRTSRCFHCFTRLSKTRVRCRNHCQWHVWYCSTQCEAAQWGRLHRVVCAFPELDTLDYVDVLLAFQVFPNTFGDLVAAAPEDLTDQQQAAIDWVCRLFCNNNNNNDPPSLSRSSTCGYYYCSWRDTLIQCLGQIRCNGFGVQSKDDDGAGVEVVGKAVYLGVSMLNHACDPNAVAFFSTEQDAIVQIRTTRTIQQGQHITISYGPLASRQASTAARRKELEDRYFFTCECDACHPSPGTAAGPETTTSKTSRSGIILCRACNAGRLERSDHVCPACRQPFDWKRLFMSESRIEHCLASGELEEALRIQSTIYDNKSAHPIGQTLDQLAHRYANEGQFEKSVDYCKQSLTIVYNIFGRTSIEAAEEMFKLCSLLFNAHMYRDAKKHIKETIKVHRMLGLDEQNPEDFNDLQTMFKFVSR